MSRTRGRFHTVDDVRTACLFYLVKVVVVEAAAEVEEEVVGDLGEEREARRGTRGEGREEREGEGSGEGSEERDARRGKERAAGGSVERRTHTTYEGEMDAGCTPGYTTHLIHTTHIRIHQA